jgi:hypothetical protein
MSDVLTIAITVLLTAAIVWLAAARFGAPGIAAHLAPLGVAIALLASGLKRPAADVLVFLAVFAWAPLTWISLRRRMRKAGN